MIYPEIINDLKNSFKKLPGIGEKSAERMALYCLNLEDDDLELFYKSLSLLKRSIRRCKKCNYLAEGELCHICNDESPNRNKKTICVVEDVRNVSQFEKLGSYHGLYHVLDGLISPLDNKNPEDLNIDSLVDRIKKDNIEEVIIAVKPSIEGETTSLYISKILEDKNVIVSKIAYGVPIGADMDYIDALTLELALEERKNISN